MLYMKTYTNVTLNFEEHENDDLKNSLDRKILRLTLVDEDS